MTAAHILVDGIVQGVGFRWFTQKLADKYGLTGWVKNRWRGDVEIIVEGPRDTIESFIGDLKAGPRYGRVDAVDVTWRETTGEHNEFKVIR